MGKRGKRGRPVKSSLICNQCKHILEIIRPAGKERDYGHVKHMYCFKCRIETAHVELRGLAEWLGVETLLPWQKELLEQLYRGEQINITGRKKKMGEVLAQYKEGRKID